MTIVRRDWRSVMAALVLCAVTTSASAQVLKHVPSDSMMVFKVKDLRAASDKLRDMSKQFGFAEISPALADPLNFLKQQLSIKQGLNEKGEAAVALLFGGFETQVIGLVPVTDYKEFIGNFSNPKKDGDVDVLNAAGQGPLYAKNLGEYAALTPVKELLGKPKGLGIGEPIARLMADRDISVFLSVKALRPALVPQLQMMKRMMAETPVKGASENQVAATRVIARQAYEFIEQIVQQCDSEVLAANVTNEWLHVMVAYEFGANTAAGRAISTIKNTDADLLKGLPQGEYLAAFGWDTQLGVGAYMVENFYVPALKAMKLPDAEAQNLQKGLGIIQAQLQAIHGGAVALTMPKPDEQNGIIHGLMFLRGDAKLMLDNARKLAAIQDALVKLAGAAMQGSIEYKQDAKTLDGVSLDEQVINYAAAAKDPNAQKAERSLEALFGGKIVMDTGIVNDETLVSTVNVNEQQLQSLVNAIKQGQSPAAGVNAAATSQLPKERVAIGYVHVGQVVQLAVRLAGSPAPENIGQLPPIGLSVGAEASTLRFDLQVPMNTVEKLVGAFKERRVQRREAR